MTSTRAQRSLDFPARRLRSSSLKTAGVVLQYDDTKLKSVVVLDRLEGEKLQEETSTPKGQRRTRRAKSQKEREVKASPKRDPYPKSSPRKEERTKANKAQEVEEDKENADKRPENESSLRSPLTSPRKSPYPKSSPRKQKDCDVSSPRKPSTPKTPCTPLGNLSIKQSPTSSARRQLLYTRGASPSLTKAKQALSTDVPDEFIGREKELEAMRKFLINAWKGGKSKKSLYMSGAPGTGKTASLKHILAGISFDQPVQEIFINCMSLKSSKDIYGKIAGELDPKYDGTQPKKYVEAKICAKNGKHILLVLDEIDQLDCKDHEILYSIFEWPHLKKSRLALVGIANALDLTDRILPRLKLSSVASPLQLSFSAYNRQEIYEIICARINSSEETVIKPMAVKFLAGKIAAISGDVRKALDVCRRAIELAEIEYQKQTVLSPVVDNTQSPSGVKQIDLPQILKIFNQVYSSRVDSSMGNQNSDLPVQQKILLSTALLITSYGHKKCKEISLGHLHETYGRICQKRKLNKLDVSEVSSLCTLLDTRGLLNVKKGKTIRDSKISLRIDEKEVELALKDKTLLSSILADTACI